MQKSIYIFIYIILALANGARISGRISTSNEKTPSQTTITALDVISGVTYTTRTTSDEYSMLLPDSSLVEIKAIGTDMVQIAEWTVPGYFPAKVGSFQIDNGNKTIDISFEPCYTLILTQYNSTGGYESYSTFSTFNYVSDNNGSPLRGMKDTIYSNTDNYDTIGIHIPLNTNVIVMTDIAIFGYDNNIVIPVDNNGKGYISNADAYGEVINLNYQVARSLLLRVNNKNNDKNNYSNIASQSILNINNAISSIVNMDDHIYIFNKTRDIVSECIYIEDILEISRANRIKDGYRNTNVSINTIDQYGKIVDGVSISFTPKQYSFNFGVYGGNYNYNTSNAWELLLDAGINTATVDFWWSSTESNTGHLDNYDIINDRIEYLLSIGLKLRATGLFQPSANIIPSYARGLNFTEFGKALKDHISYVVRTYCTKFDSIEILTDLNILGRSLGFTDSEILLLQKISVDTIILNAPGVKTSISSSNTYIPNDNNNSWNVPMKGSYSFTKDYISYGIQIDDIGYNIYNGINAEPQYTLGLLSDILDKYNDNIDKPIRVSKFTIPSSIVSRKNREEYINRFYNMAYSKKNVNEITWSNMISDTNGLFDTNMKPTSLYYIVKDIISSCRNNINSIITMDNMNEYRHNSLFVGGRYNMNVFKDGNNIGSSEIILNEGKNAKLSVVYDSINNKAVIINNNGYNGILPGALPPTPSPKEIISKNNINNNINNIPPYGVFLIVFGTILFIASISSMIIFITLRRIRNMKNNNNNVDIETSIPVGNTLPRDITDSIDIYVKLDDDNNNQDDSISPPEGPLATSMIELEEDVNVAEVNDEMNESSSDSDSMEDVELDEDDVRTTSSSDNDSDEEHL